MSNGIQVPSVFACVSVLGSSCSLDVKRLLMEQWVANGPHLCPTTVQNSHNKLLLQIEIQILLSCVKWVKVVLRTHFSTFISSYRTQVAEL